MQETKVPSPNSWVSCRFNSKFIQILAHRHHALVIRTCSADRLPPAAPVEKDVRRPTPLPCLLGKGWSTWEFRGIHGHHILQQSDIVPCPKAIGSLFCRNWGITTWLIILINSWQISWSVHYGHCWSHCWQHVENASCAVIGIPPASCQNDVHFISCFIPTDVAIQSQTI